MKFTDKKVRQLAAAVERATQVRWLDGYANPGDGGRYVMLRGGLGGPFLRAKPGKSASKQACVYLLAGLLESDRLRGVDSTVTYPWLAELVAHLRPYGKWINGFEDIAAKGVEAVPTGGVNANFTELARHGNAGFDVELRYKP